MDRVWKILAQLVHPTIAVLALLFVNVAGAQEISYPTKPSNQHFWVDNASLIDSSDASAIDQMASALLKDEQVALYVVTIDSLERYGASQYSIENYAARLFDHWGIGFSDRNYGVLLLVSKGDRRARIELGADWAHDYDVDAQKIMDTLIIPSFKAGNFSSGIAKGVEGLNSMARGLALPPRVQPPWLVPTVIVLFVLTFLVAISLIKSGRQGWGWSLLAVLGVTLAYLLATGRGYGTGSSGGFGGGSSGGGGASGGW